MCISRLRSAIAGRRIGVAEDVTAAAYLEQSVNALVSACQRLMPLGQQRAARIL
jgi:urease accessory protein UreF